MTEVEVVNDVLDIGREAVEIGLEVGFKLLLACSGLQVTQGEFRGIVKGLTRCLAKGRILLDHPSGVERGPHVQNLLLSALKHRIQAA